MPQQHTLTPGNLGRTHAPPYLRCLEYLPRTCPEPVHPGVGQLGGQAVAVTRGTGSARMGTEFTSGPTPDPHPGEQKTVSEQFTSEQLRSLLKINEITPPFK